MMKHMGETQRVLISRQMDNEHAQQLRRKKRADRLHIDIALGLGGLTMAAIIGFSMVFVVQDRIRKYPHLGDGWIPKTEEQRRLEALPKVYTGR
jgi:hypothetical protein